MDRSHVTAATAGTLRTRMRQSKSLLYAHSVNSANSHWMPWELGYFDGYNGNVAILPIAPRPQDDYHGDEYLGVYPYAELTNDGWTRQIDIHESRFLKLSFGAWLSGTDKLR